jgi:hypothetical protein
VRRLAKASFAGSIDGTGSSRGHFRRAFAGLAGTGSIALVLALFAVPAASAAEPWGYEQVSPFDKGTAAVSAIDTYTVARDGETILYSAMGSFNEVPSISVPLYNRYFATRGEDRWYSRSTELPYDIDKNGITESAQFAVMITLRASVNLKYALTTSARALLPGAIENGSNLYMQELATGDLKLVAAHPNNLWTRQSITHLGQTSYYWVGPNGDEALFYSDQELNGLPKGVFKWTEQGGIEAAVFDAEGNPNPVNAPGPSGGYDTGTHEPLPAEGALDHLYVSRNFLVPAQLIEDGKAVPISVSQRADDKNEEGNFAVKNAEVAAVADGGRFAFFISNGPLTEGPAPSTFKTLHRYDRTNGALTYIGHGSGTGTSLQVIQASEDGQTIAFISSAGLLPGVANAPAQSTNLYVWRNGSLRFVSTGEANSNLGRYMRTRTLHVLSRDGRYLYFTDNSKALAEKFGTEPTSLACAEAKAPAVPLPCNQVYLYDAGAIGEDKLQCVSCVDGTALGHNGDVVTENSGYVRFNNHPNQYVSNDGRAFFATKNSYDPADTNGLADVYEFHQGEYRLVSTAASGHSARFIDASDDGKVVYFTTTAPIVPQDQDKAMDLYITREGAGFEYKPDSGTPPCLGLEACHGPIAGVGPGAGPSTPAFEGLVNPKIVNGTLKMSKATVRGTVATITVRVSARGKVSASGNGVVKATKRAKKAGKVTLKVRLTKKSKSALQTKGNLRRTVQVAFAPDEGRGASANRALAFKASAGKGGS